MASAMAVAAAHSMPPFPLPAMPRIRPPPIPKGTPGPNTLPIPNKLPPPQSKKRIWADGKWTTAQSNAAKQKRQIISRQLEKALRHEIHGMNIYAYRHIRTQQVVYSLTKNMENNKILKQLLFHGKQTVPAALRRDVWRPYFSIHFPKTPSGAYKGLQVYRQLRELALKRQLDPPEELSHTTEEDVQRIKRVYSPLELKEKLEIDPTERGAKYHRLQLPVVGKRLPPKLLAKRLMNQKATSVADTAAILAKMVQKTTARRQPVAHDDVQAVEDAGLNTQLVEPAMASLTPPQLLTRAEERKKEREAGLSARAHDRLMTIRIDEAERAEEIEAREKYLERRRGEVQIDKHSLSRISTEYDANVNHDWFGRHTKLHAIEEKDRQTESETGAQDALDQALADIQAERDVERKKIENTMSAQIRQELAKLSSAERDEIKKDMEAERADNQKLVEARIAEEKDEQRAQRRSLKEKSEASPSKQNLRDLRSFDKESSRKMLDLRADQKLRHIKWVGPYSDIPAAFDAALTDIDRRWEPKLVQLRREAERERVQHGDLTHHEVEIRWSDIRDGTLARQWPDTVFHAELQARAVVKSTGSVVTGYVRISDEDEQPFQALRAPGGYHKSSSVHVFGSETQNSDNPNTTGRWENPSELSATAARIRQQRVEDWTQQETVLVRGNILNLRRESSALEPYFADALLNKETMQSTAYCYEAVESAQTTLQNILEGGEEAESRETLKELFKYLRENFPFAEEELAHSTSPDADRARLDYMKLQLELLELESKHPEARRQAIMRADLDNKFIERERIESRIRHYSTVEDDDIEYGRANTDLKRFDDEFPLIHDTIERSGILSLEQMIADAGETISQKESELQSEPSEALMAEIKKLKFHNEGRLQEQTKIMREIRDDQTAWAEIKAAGGVTKYINKHMVGSSRFGKDDVVVAQPGTWQRVKRLFNRG